MTLNQLEKALNIEILTPQEKQKEKVLRDFKESMVRVKFKGSLQNLQKSTLQEHVTPKYPIFEQFVARGGMNFIIKDIL